MANSATGKGTAINSQELAQKTRDILEEKHALNIVVMDVQGISGITDFYIITHGTSTPHLKALAADVSKALKEEGVPCYRQSGTAESGWLVLDYVDVVIHVFSESAREYYDLESLWKDIPQTQ